MMFGVIGFIIGIVLGSFSKVLADRSLNKKTFLGRSYCVYCKHTLAWYDLFPVLSYILLRGKCRYCHKKIGVDYLVYELSLGVVFAIIFNNLFVSLPAIELSYSFIIFALNIIFITFFITVLGIVTLTDLKEMLIPDRIILPALLIVLIYLIGVTVYKIYFLYYSLSVTTLGKYLLPPFSDYFYRHALTISTPLLGSLIMGASIGGFFLLLIIITRGKGMGGGDVKLGAFIGLGLSFPMSLVALIFSFLTGAIVSVLLIIFGKKHFGQTIPFGPFLVLGAIIAIFFGEAILNWYLNLSLIRA